MWVARLAAAALCLIWTLAVLISWWAAVLSDSLRDDGHPSPSAFTSLLGLLTSWPTFATFVVSAPLAAVVLWRGPWGRTSATRALCWASLPAAAIAWLATVLQITYDDV